MRLILFIYFFSRLFNLLILPFFTDESSYAYTAMQMKDNLIRNWDLTLNLPVVKPPLFFFITILFESITNNALLAGRLVSVFSGVATLLGLYVLTVRLFGKKTAFATALFYILSPFALTYDRLALMDSLMAAFSVWILFIAIKYTERKKILFLLFLILLCTLALFTKQSGKFFLLMLPFIPLLMNGKKNLKSFFILIIISVISYLIYLIILGRSHYFNFYNNFDKTYINLSLDIIINNLRAVLSWTRSYFPLIFIFIPISIFYILRKNLRSGLILMFWALVPVLISAGVGQYFFPRYLLPSIVLLFPILAFLFKKYLWLLLIILIPSIIFDFYIIFNPPKAPYHFNERDQFISGWPAGYGVKEAYIKLNSLDKKAKFLVEGDNGHLYHSFKLMGAKFPMQAFKQNSEVKENADYILFNRKGGKIIPNLEQIWSYQRNFNGDSLILYEIKHE